jgi:(2Fe-2S) ferredoxin
MPKRERYVWVCTNRRPEGNPKGSCAQHGSEALQLALKSAVAEAGLHQKVRVMTAGCMDLCWVGASVAVMPDDTFLGRVTEGDIPAIVEALGRRENVATSPALRERVVKPEEFDDPAKKLVAKPAPGRSE